MKKALVPLDGSAFSKQVLSSVHRLLDPQAFALTLLRVAPLPHGIQQLPPRPVLYQGLIKLTYESTDSYELARHPVYTDHIVESFRTRLLDEMEGDARLLSACGFRVTLAVRFGEPVQEIAGFVTKEGMDLVVMATHDRSGLGHTLLGSVAESVLRQVHVPVMMLRPEDSTTNNMLPSSLAQGSRDAQLRRG